MQQLKQVEFVHFEKALNCLFVKNVVDSTLRKQIATGYWVKQITITSSNKTFSFESTHLISALQDPASYPLKIVFLNPYYVASIVCSSNTSRLIVICFQSPAGMENFFKPSLLISIWMEIHYQTLTQVI